MCCVIYDAFKAILQISTCQQWFSHVQQADPVGPLAVARAISFDSRVISAQSISPFLPSPSSLFLQQFLSSLER